CPLLLLPVIIPSGTIAARLSSAPALRLDGLPGRQRRQLPLRLQRLLRLRVQMRLETLQEFGVGELGDLQGEPIPAPPPFLSPPPPSCARGPSHPAGACYCPAAEAAVMFAT